MNLITFALEHKAAVTVAGAWAVREAHNVWPALKMAWPFCKTNGGAFGVAWTFCFGNFLKKQPANSTPPTPEKV